MSSHCTPTRLVPWRVKHLASCFYACRFPLEETERQTDIPPQIPNESAVFDSRGSCRGHKACRKRKVIKKKRDKNGKPINNSSRIESISDVRTTRDGNVAADTRWPHFEEEDYIVFCFRDDGEIHMINEVKSSESIDDKDDEEAKNNALRPSEKVDEEEGDETETEWPPDETEEIDPNEEEPSARKMDSFESCDSNVSDTSTSSFAFPILGIEWIGSPVQMPKSDKSKPTSVNFQCCRF